MTKVTKVTKEIQRWGEFTVDDIVEYDVKIIRSTNPILNSDGELIQEATKTIKTYKNRGVILKFVKDKNNNITSFKIKIIYAHEDSWESEGNYKRIYFEDSNDVYKKEHVHFLTNREKNPEYYL